MGDSARNCKRIATMESSTSSFSKKMKIDFGIEELKLPSAPIFAAKSQGKNVSPAILSAPGGVLARDFSGYSPAPGCSSNMLKNINKNLDLEVESFETESSFCIDNKFSTETTPSNYFCGDTDDMASSTAEKTTSQERTRTTARTTARTTPNEAELDEFFAALENKEQESFQEKYNYDVVNDVPLEGRYEWVPLTPEIKGEKEKAEEEKGKKGVAKVTKGST